MERNIARNRSAIAGSIEAREIDWSNEKHLAEVTNEKADIVLVSDCIYYEASLKPLVGALNKLSSPSTEIFLSYEERTSDQKQALQRGFFELINEVFEVHRFSMSDCHPEYASPDIHIVRLKKRKG